MLNMTSPVNMHDLSVVHPTAYMYFKTIVLAIYMPELLIKYGWDGTDCTMTG